MSVALFRIAAVLCFLAVALGAFGAHGLLSTLEAHGMLDAWNKAVFYQFVHAVVLLALALYGNINRGNYGGNINRGNYGNFNRGSYNRGSKVLHGFVRAQINFAAGDEKNETMVVACGKVNDGKADSNTAVVAITINHINHPPTLTVPGPQTVKKNQNLTFEVSATDVDAGDIISITAPNRPAGSSFIETTRRFTWTPSCTQTGTFFVTFAAVDNGRPALSDTKTVQITVLDDNCPPTLILPGPQTVNQGQLLAFTVGAVAS